MSSFNTWGGGMRKIKGGRGHCGLGHLGFWSVRRQCEDMEFWGRASKRRLNSEMRQTKGKHQRKTFEQETIGNSAKVWSAFFHTVPESKASGTLSLVSLPPPFHPTPIPWSQRNKISLGDSTCNYMDTLFIHTFAPSLAQQTFTECLLYDRPWETMKIKRNSHCPQRVGVQLYFTTHGQMVFSH